MIIPYQVYRHFKGGLYLVLSIAMEESSLEPTIVYMSLNGDGKVWSRKQTDFMSLVPEGKPNPTGQKLRFEQVHDLHQPLATASTESLVAELRKRKDNPYADFDLESMNERVLKTEYSVVNWSEPNENMPRGYPIMNLMVTDSEAKARKFCENNGHRVSRHTKIVKETLVEIESFD